MCHLSCIEFFKVNLGQDEVKGRSVLEVGSLNVNGSVRPIVEAFHPASYLGVDIQNGPGVDEICDACDLIKHFGPNRFDLLISTEVLEHVRDWRKVVSNFKNVVKPGGMLLITTRSKGFGYHGFPFDYWRFEGSDVRDIFSDFIIESVENDLMVPGVFLKARKPEFFLESKNRDIRIFTVITGKREENVNYLNIFLFGIRYKLSPILSKIFPSRVNSMLKSLHDKLQSF